MFVLNGVKLRGGIIIRKRKNMLEVREGKRCYPEAVEGVNVGLACVDGVIAFLALYQVFLVFLSNFYGI